MVVLARNAAARNVRIAVIRPVDIAPGTLFGASHVEAERAVAVEPASHLLIALRIELQGIQLVALLDAAIVAATVTDIKVSHTTVST